jgi:hypothetical protein
MGRLQAPASAMGQAFADRALVARVDVVGVAHVDADGHAGGGQRERLALGFAQLGEGAALGQRRARARRISARSRTASPRRPCSRHCARQSSMRRGKACA